ncbi:MAG: type II secretion system F family protein [Lactobacillus sp.]|nr:type II secretion system F family protein [Lactobacillus sp.]
MNKRIKDIKPVKLKLKQQATFLLILAKLLENGFSIEMALESMRLILPDENPLLINLIQQLDKGQSLADTLALTGLSKTILSQITIADIHGNLIKCLRENAATLTIRQKNLQKILNLLAYPCFLLISLISLIVFLKVEMAQQLPQLALPTMYWILVKILVGLIILGIIGEIGYIVHATETQRALHQMRWPIIGSLYRNYFHYVILSAVATFLKSGLSLNEILVASKQLTLGSIQRQLAEKVQQQILTGISLSQIIKHNPFLPTEINIAMNLGHSAKQTALELQTIAEIKHQRLQQQMQKLINQIQPLFFLLVAVLILGTYLSILLPIYSLMKGM